MSANGNTRSITGRITPGIDEGTQLAQLLAVGGHEQERVSHRTSFGLAPDGEAQGAHRLHQNPVGAEFAGEHGVGWAGDRDDRAAGFEHMQRLLQRLPALSVQNDVVTGQFGGEVLGLVVDDDVGTQVLDPAGIGGAGRGGDGRAEVFGQLDGDAAQSAGTRVDQHLLTGLNVGLLDQRLPRGERDQWQGGGFGHVESLGLGL